MRAAAPQHLDEPDDLRQAPAQTSPAEQAPEFLPRVHEVHVYAEKAAVGQPRTVGMTRSSVRESVSAMR